ncbi:MAG: phospholipid carrier-dependent glycosyltransferase [Bacteroidota bacterium]
MKPKTKEQAKKPGYLQALSLLALVISCILVYSLSLSNGILNWDDNKYLFENPYLSDFSLKGIRAVFSSFYMGNYHPLTTLSWMIDYAMAGFKPGWYHFSNLFLHTFNTILVFFLVKRLFKDHWTAFLTALLFAFHPMHVESVAWISERKDVLYAFFFLCSLISYLGFNESRKRSSYIWSLLFFLLALLSKSAAISLAPVLLLFDYFLQRRFSWQTIYEKIPFFFLAITFGIIALSSQGIAMDESFAPHFPIWQRFFIVCYNLDFYLLSFFVPAILSPLHPYPMVPGSSLPVLFWLAPFILFTIGIAIYFLKKYRQLLVFGLLFFVLTIAMVLQFIPVGRAIVAERYTYLPYIGLSVILVVFVLKWARSKSSAAGFYRFVPLGILIAGLIAFAGISNARVTVWKDSNSLFSDIIKKYPNDAWAYYNRGLTRFYANDNDGAIEDYTQSILLKPDNVVAWYNRSLAYVNKQDFPHVINDLDHAIELKPDYLDALKNRGNAKASQKDYLGSIIDYSSALKIHPADTMVLVNRSLSYYFLNDLEKACADLTEAKRLGSKKAVGMSRDICKN